MRELHDALPIPDGWDKPKARRIIERTGNRSTPDTTAVRLTEHAGEPVTLIGTSVRARLVGMAGPLLLGVVVTFWIAADAVEAWPLDPVWFVGLVAIMVIMSVIGLANAIAGPGELALSRSGVRLRSGLSWTYLPWSAARCVKAKVTLYGEGGPQWLVMITCDSPKSLRTGGVPQPFRRRNALRIYADFLAIDRVLLYHLLRFYNEHPRARVELGTPASIDRIHSREFP